MVICHFCFKLNSSSSPGLKSGLGVIVASSISIVLVVGGAIVELDVDRLDRLENDVDGACNAEAGDAGVEGVDEVMKRAWDI